jgi:hypothetical protein
MNNPLTNDDLYGTSKNEKDSSPSAMKESVPLQYEETPEIPMPEHTVSSGSVDTAHRLPAKKVGCIGTVMTAIVFIVLFIGGIWLSSVVRQFVPSDTQTPTETQTTAPTGSPSATGPVATGSAAVAAWQTYEVISGITKTQFAGITFQLPSDVLSPICDGTGCASQGTYLPGGTRFTVAARGAGQALTDFRGSVISDVGGISFTTKPTTVAGLPATEFTGVFSGRTISGYGFSRMRGFMVEISPTTSLEINHFTPTGIVADFAADDTLFDAILKTIKIGGSASVSATLMPTRTPTPTIVSTTPTATPSGY